MADPEFGSPHAAPHTVTDPRLAAALTDPHARRYWGPFLGRVRGAQAAAHEAGCGLDAMRHRIRTFVRCGLLVVAGERRRAGRPVTLYRTAHDAYFVPHALTPFATLEEHLYRRAEPGLRRWVRATARRLHDSGREGVRLYRDDRGEVWSESAGTATGEGGLAMARAGAARSPGFDIETTLHLSAAQAGALQAALLTLVDDWQPLAGSGQGHAYTLVLRLFAEHDGPVG